MRRRVRVKGVGCSRCTPAPVELPSLIIRLPNVLITDWTRVSLVTVDGPARHACCCVGGLLAYHVSRVGAMRTELKATAQYDSPALNAVPGADVELRDDAEELGGYVSEAPFSKAAPQSYS